jgi:hypothetical protein
VQIRALLEGTTADDMLHNWHEILPQKMEDWALDRSAMVELFGSTRDEWMAEDLQGWLAPNRIYPRVGDALKSALGTEESEVYIVTTKQVGAQVQGHAVLCKNCLQSSSSCCSLLRDVCRHGSPKQS